MNVSQIATFRRAAALTILAVVIGLTIAAIVLPIYFANKHYDLELSRLQRQLGTFSALYQSEPTLIKAVEAMKQREAGKYFLKGTSSALASAELQDVVKATIEGNGGRLLSTQALASSEESGYRRFVSTFQITANIQNLRRILYMLEANQPYLFVGNLTIRSQVPANYKPAAGVEPDLFIQFDISGYSAKTPTADIANAPAASEPAKAKV